jgi:NAD(P)-dependent dehydrogenase (short-subunit alcohol dehydrogenase family)
MPAAPEPTSLLRPLLLRGVRVVLARPQQGAAEALLARALEALGAEVAHVELEAAADAEQREARLRLGVEAALARLGGGLDVLVVLAGALPDSPAAAEALLAGVGACWDAARAVAELALLPAGAGGRIVLVAPPRGQGVQSSAALAALENLARTLSIEWARHGVTVVAVAPGAGAGAEGELASVIAYLASPAGAYFSGCLLDLRGADGALPGRENKEQR